MTGATGAGTVGAVAAGARDGGPPVANGGPPSASPLTDPKIMGGTLEVHREPSRCGTGPDRDLRPLPGGSHASSLLL